MVRGDTVLGKLLPLFRNRSIVDVGEDDAAVFSTEPK